MKASNLIHVIETHIEHVKAGGLPVLWHKMKRVAGYLFWPVFWAFAFPIVVLLRPFLLIRFGEIHATRIGHFVYDVAFYLAEREAGLYPRRSIDLFYYHGAVSNAYLADLCKRYLHVSSGIEQAIRLFKKLPGGQRHILRIIGSQIIAHRDLDGVLYRTPRRIFLSKAEEDRGWRELLDRWRVERNAPIVCFQVRSSAYLDQYLDKSAQAIFRERSAHRNANIHDFEPAMLELAKLGYTCFRMGAVPDVPLNVKHARIIDYANDGRSEFLDVFLSSSCRFFVTSGTGIDALADLFRKPIVYCDEAIVEAVHAWQPNLTIFKRQREAKTNRILTFREIIETGLGAAFDGRVFTQRGVELIDNSADEITSVVSEMVARLDGTFKESPGDRERQEKFWSLLRGSPYQGFRTGWVGASFLRDHVELLK